MKRRYELLDILRGVALINMIIYHACWDLKYLFGVNMPWYESTGAYIWQQCICHTFILLSGFCFHFGRKPLQRGLIVLAASAVVSIGAGVVGTTIKFGVLTLIGSSMCICAAAKKWLEKVPAYIGAVGSLIIFAACRHIARGKVLGLSLPDALYANDFTAYLGFAPKQFSSGDYFTLLPWLFLFLCGFYLYKIFVQHDLLKYLHCSRFKLLAWCGRYSLYLYMLHQPVTYGLLALLF